MTTAPKPFVFVLMPFAKAFDDLYNLGIRPACEEAGAYCERVDEQHFDGRILDRVYNQIATAKFIVAVMSGRNANVFYEVGYAHALNKRVILLMDNVDEIPFDLSAYPHIIYSSITKLKEELSKRLSTLIAQPEAESTYFDCPIKLLYNGKPLDTISEVRMIDKMFSWSSLICASKNKVALPIDIVNSTEKSILQFDFRVGFVCSSEIIGFQAYQDLQRDSAYPVLSSKQADGHLFYLINSTFSLLPGDFTKLFIYLYKGQDGKNVFRVEERVDLSIRILTAAGPFNQDFKFTIKQVCPTGDNPA